MAGELRAGWAVAAAAVGAAALGVAFWPAPWPNPLRDGACDPAAARSFLLPAAAAVDAAAARGDELTYAAVTTAAHRRERARQLGIVGGELDAATLQQLAAVAPLAAWFDQPIVAARAAGPRAVIAVARGDGQGVQLLGFHWDGWQFRYDGGRHAPHAGGAPAQAVEAAVRAR